MNVPSWMKNLLAAGFRRMALMGACLVLFGGWAAANPGVGHLVVDTRAHWFLNLKSIGGSGDGYLAVNRLVGRIQLPEARIPLGQQTFTPIEVPPECEINFSAPAYLGAYGLDVEFELVTPDPDIHKRGTILLAAPGQTEGNITAGIRLSWKPRKGPTLKRVDSESKDLSRSESSSSLALLAPDPHPAPEFSMQCFWPDRTAKGGYMFGSDCDGVLWYLQRDPDHCKCWEEVCCCCCLDTLSSWKEKLCAWKARAGAWGKKVFCCGKKTCCSGGKAAEIEDDLLESGERASASESEEKTSRCGGKP